jgi:hypothetical protein
MKARRSKEDWQVLILRQAESGLSAQQFCRDNDVCPKYSSIRKMQLGFPSHTRSTKRRALIPVGKITGAPVSLRMGELFISKVLYW